MKKVSVTITLLVAFALYSGAPNIEEVVHRDRLESIVKATLEEDALNKRVETILETIRIIESRNRYEVKGASGEYGAYQFTTATWRYYCQVFFKEYLDITVPENQDKVAEAKIRMLIKNGFTDEEIASFWNSGRKEYKGRIGTNKYGVQYNVPAYVKHFINVRDNLI